MQDDLIAVTQADREAAADVFATTDWSRTQFLTGKRDKDKKVQRIARHRQQAEDAMRERCAVIVDQRLALIPTLTDRAATAVLICLPDAIRATPPKPDRLNGEGA